MGKNVVPSADDQPCFAGHSGVGGVTCEHVAENAVVCVGRDTSNHITWVDVLERNGNTFAFEVGCNAFFEVRANVEVCAAVLDIAGSVVSERF